MYRYKIKMWIRLPDSPDTRGRKPNPAAKKKLRILKYPDTSGQGVIKLKFVAREKNLQLFESALQSETS